MRALKGGDSAIVSSPCPAPGPVLSCDGRSIAPNVCTEWVNKCMHEWMNRKLKTKRKKIEQKMQKKLGELLVRHSSRPPMSRKGLVNGQCRCCRPHPQNFSSPIPPPPPLHWELSGTTWSLSLSNPWPRWKLLSKQLPQKRTPEAREYLVLNGLCRTHKLIT